MTIMDLRESLTWPLIRPSLFWKREFGAYDVVFDNFKASKWPPKLFDGPNGCLNLLLGRASLTFSVVESPKKLLSEPFDERLRTPRLEDGVAPGKLAVCGVHSSKFWSSAIGSSRPPSFFSLRRICEEFLSNMLGSTLANRVEKLFLLFAL